MSVNETARMIQHYSGVQGAYYEFGMGGSTHLACFFLPPAARLHAVDSSDEWVRKTAADPCLKKMASEGRAEFKHVDIGPLGPWGGLPADESSKHLWQDYAASINTRKGAQVDLILVDGRFRVACVLRGALAFPEATILVHDFWKPDHHVDYVQLLEVVDVLERTDTLLSLRLKPSASRESILAMIEKNRWKPA